MHDIKTLIGISAQVAGIIGFAIMVTTLIVKLVKSEKEKLKLNKNDGYYYAKRDTANPYCPRCYKAGRTKARITYGKCEKCGEVYKTPPVVIETCPRPGPKLRI